MAEAVRGSCLTPAIHTRMIGALPAGASWSRISTYVARTPGTCIDTITISAANAASVSYSITFVVVP